MLHLFPGSIEQGYAQCRLFLKENYLVQNKSSESFICIFALA